MPVRVPLTTSRPTAMTDRDLERHVLRVFLEGTAFLVVSLLVLWIAAGTVSAQDPPHQHEPTRQGEHPALGPHGDFARGGEPGSESDTAVDPATAPRLTWVEPAGGLWSDPANWSGGSVPGPSDHAVIDRPGDYVVTLDTEARITALTLGGEGATPTLVLRAPSLRLAGPSRVAEGATLHLDGGIVTGPGDLLVDGTLLWTGGTLSGAATTLIGASARLELSGPKRKYLSLRHLDIGGEATWSGGSLVVTFETPVRVLEGGRLVATGETFFDVYGPPGPSLTNLGCFARTGEGRTLFEAPVANAGRLEVAAGTFEALAGYRAEPGSATRLAAEAEIEAPEPPGPVERVDAIEHPCAPEGKG